MIPPALLRLHVKEKNKRGLRLWIPLFLLWPLLLIAAVIVLPVALFVAIARLNPWRGFQVAIESYRLCCAFRGLAVNVDSPEQTVKIQVW